MTLRHTLALSLMCISISFTLAGQRPLGEKKQYTNFGQIRARANRSFANTTTFVLKGVATVSASCKDVVFPEFDKAYFDELLKMGPQVVLVEMELFCSEADPTHFSYELKVEAASDDHITEVNDYIRTHQDLTHWGSKLHFSKSTAILSTLTFYSGMATDTTPMISVNELFGFHYDFSSRNISSYAKTLDEFSSHLLTNQKIDDFMKFFTKIFPFESVLMAMQLEEANTVTMSTNPLFHLDDSRVTRFTTPLLGSVIFYMDCREMLKDPKAMCFTKSPTP